MKISVSCGGRFHGFDMATYFQKVGVLDQLVTGYPKSQTTKFGIKNKHVRSIYINEVINRLTNKLGMGYPLNTLACQIYDWITAQLITKNSDAYFLWSGYSLYTIKAIKSKNPKAKIILVRGSSHILTQQELLQKINPNKKNVIDKKMVKRELLEYELADFISVPSTFVLDSFLNRGVNNKKLFLNFLGVDLNDFPFQNKGKSNTLRFGSVGTLCARKNTQGIIDNFIALNEHFKGIQLILVGPIDEFSFDKKSLNHPNIFYIDKVTQQELYREYAKFDIFIMNSVEEGMAMVQLQALSSGCPLIGTRNSGAEDLIQDFENGVLINAFDNTSLKNAMEWFILNKDRLTEQSIKARNGVVSGFTWDDFGKRNIDFVKQILA